MGRESLSNWHLSSTETAWMFDTWTMSIDKTKSLSFGCKEVQSREKEGWNAFSESTEVTTLVIEHRCLCVKHNKDFVKGICHMLCSR